MYFIKYQILLHIVTCILHIINCKINDFVTCSSKNHPRQQMKAFIGMWRMDLRIRPYVIQAGFYGIYCVGHIMINWPLITCLVERWWPETHMFHIPFGEMTITLQDADIILELRIHEPTVIGTCVFDVAELSMSPHPLMLSKDSISPYDGYVTSYPP